MVLNIADVHGNGIICNQRIARANVMELEAPKVTLPDADHEKKYLLIMADPDAPNNCVGELELCYWMHWVVADVPGTSIADSSLEGAKTLLKYAPPSPPSGSGIHRYQFFVFEQKPGAKFDSEAFKEGRGSFNLNEYINDNSLCEGLVATFQYTVSAEYD